jgi:Tol biopolymer transport system component
VALAPGTRLGPYEILSAIGAGGMGEVYRARDTKLNRDVALKILPDAFTLDGDRIARFRREAQVLASLNHSNIAAIYGFEDSGTTHALVLELVEGPTLADRIAKGSIPINEALAIAKQIAEALEAAHEQGIIHRDLKPANIKVRDDGTVKVLDFGLAKALEPASAISPVFTASPTITTPAQMTAVGMILGTAAYMSPEQAKGRPADKRSDIWAFGCVLFEMLSGKRAFDGEDVSDTLAFVLTKSPAWDALPLATPTSIRRLLQRSLEKDRKRRLADVSDARLEIDDALSAPATELSAAVTPDLSRAGWRTALPWAAALAVVMAAGLAFLHFSEKPPAAPVINASLLPPGGTEFNFALGVGLPALAPDGSRLVFGAVLNDKRMLYVRRLDASTAQVLPGSEEARFPFWSPDSRWVAFEQRGTLKKIDTQGGPPITLGNLSVPQIRGGTWSPAGVILISSGGQILRMSAAGGTGSVVISNANGAPNMYPWFLPDGRHFLYGLSQSGDMPLRVASIDEPGKPGRVVAQVHSNAMYAQGHLLYLRERTLMAQPFEPRRFETTGEAVPIAEGIPTFQSPSRAAGFTVSAGGLLVYTSSPASGNARLVWKDRQGKTVGTLGEANGFVGQPALSPDGKHLAIARRDNADNVDTNIWILDTDTGIPTRFTFGTGRDREPVWSPDGRTLYFASDRNGKVDLYRTASNGAAQEDVVVSSGGTKITSGVSPDGQLLMYFDSDVSVSRTPGIWVAPLATARADTKAEPRVFLQERYPGAGGVFGPDGHWVAYVGGQRGQLDVYIVPFPGPGGRRQVSSGGVGSGTGRPQWRRDGKELFYETATGDLMAAEVFDHGSVLEIGKTQKLFGGLVPRVWTASPDGQKFIVAEEPGSEAARPLTLVQNWAAAIRK